MAARCRHVGSEVEGLPCSLIEAMSAGLATVVSNIPAHTQLVDDGVDGVVTELGDEESIARGLVRVLDDRALRDRLGAAARKRMVEQFSTDRVVDRYETLFAECTNGKQSGGGALDERRPAG
jgi:glycosyltransferase involved in cell wall biosynthesis